MEKAEVETDRRRPHQHGAGDVHADQERGDAGEVLGVTYGGLGDEAPSRMCPRRSARRVRRPVADAERPPPPHEEDRHAMLGPRRVGGGTGSAGRRGRPVGSRAAGRLSGDDDTAAPMSTTRGHRTADGARRGRGHGFDVSHPGAQGLASQAATKWLPPGVGSLSTVMPPQDRPYARHQSVTPAAPFARRGSRTHAPRTPRYHRADPTGTVGSRTQLSCSPAGDQAVLRRSPLDPSLTGAATAPPSRDTGRPVRPP